MRNRAGRGMERYDGNRLLDYNSYLNIAMGFYLPAMCILTPRSGKKSVAWLAFSSLYVVWFLLSRYVMKFSSVVYPFICIIVISTALLELLYRDSRKRKLAVLVYWFFTGVIGDITGVLCMSVFIPEAPEIYFKGQIPEATIMTSLLGSLCCGVSIMVEAIVYFCLIWKKQKKLFAAFLLLPVYQFVLGAGFFMLCYDFTEQVAWIGIVIEAFCSVVDIMMLYFLESILQKQDVEAKIREQERLRRQEYAYFEAAGRSAQELRMIRHDFSNHLQAVYKMSDGDGNRETDREMVRKMLEEMSRRIGRQEVDVEYGREEQGVVCTK